MSSARTRMAASLVAIAASALVFGQASSALAADDPRGFGRGDGSPVLVVSPAPGKLTKERKVTTTYSYDAKGGGSSSEEQPPPPPGAPAPAPEPGPVTALKDTANAAAQSVTSGASSTVDAAAK